MHDELVGRGTGSRVIYAFNAKREQIGCARTSKTRNVSIRKTKINEKNLQNHWEVLKHNEIPTLKEHYVVLITLKDSFVYMTLMRDSDNDIPGNSTAPPAGLVRHSITLVACPAPNRTQTPTLTPLAWLEGACLLLFIYFFMAEMKEDDAEEARRGRRESIKAFSPQKIPGKKSYTTHYRSQLVMLSYRQECLPPSYLSIKCNKMKK